MATPRPPSRIPLDELLLRHGAITQEQLAKAKEEQRTIGGDLGRVLVDLGFISEDLLIRAWAHQLGIARVAPEAMEIAADLLQAIPVLVCERFGILAVGRDPRTEALVVATSDPANPEHLRAIGLAVGKDVVPVAATTESIERGIRRHYYGEEPKAPGAGAAKDPFGPPDAQPQFAALLARLEQLEQQTHSREAQILAVLRAIGDILVERGLVSREEYLRRARTQ
jgi:Type II secretion system (T2SS), protein E, N-terminal domain